jgi:phosphopantetheinyl transferase
VLPRLPRTGPVELWQGPLRPGEESEELLRRVLAERLGVAAVELRFGLGERGKPELVGEELVFNLSHAGGLALIGVAERGAVGVDLEQVRSLRRLDLLAEGALSGAEGEALRRAGDEEEQTRWFLRRWTAKEAVAKAFGLGLALAPQRLEVEAIDGERGLVGVAASDEGPLPAGAEPVEVRWLEPADGFVAAVAALP